MPAFSTNQRNALASGDGTWTAVLLWIVARNRLTGLDEPIGFWTGADHRSFVIGGETRAYFGAGAVIEVPPIRASIGLNVQVHRVVLPPLVDEVQQAIRIYEPKGARVQIHQALFDLETGDLIDAPVRFVKGKINKVSEVLPEAGGDARLELSIASAARSLTRGLPLMKSAAALQLRDPAAKGRTHSDVVTEWQVPWGESG